jgi:hypothetical protein
MLTMCSAATPASARVHNADAADAPGNVPRGPARDVKPSGTLGCKNAGSNVHAGQGNVRSNPAVRTAVSKNLRTPLLGAGPRATLSRQLMRLAARADAADTAAPGRVAAHARKRWLDNARSPADAASAELLADNLRCNSVLADAAARTAVHIP